MVTIKPLHSLVQAVMGKTGKAALLLKKGASPHGFSLKPSQRSLIENADVLFFISPSLETFLESIIKNPPKNLSLISADKTPDLILYKTRHSKGDTTPHDCASCQSHGTNDMHFWLSPLNAEKILLSIRDSLSSLDPKNTSIYNANTKAYIEKVKLMDQKIKKRLSPLRKIPFMVFHDGYQYFERHYDLHSVGSLKVTPQAPLSGKRLSEITKKIQKENIACIFSEPQFPTRLVTLLLKKSPHTKSAMLDPLGVDLPTGASLYLHLLNDLSLNIEKGLKH